MNKIIFRVDGDSTIGAGHLVRCLALAEVLSGHFEIKFVLKRREESLMALLHQYHFKGEGLSSDISLEEELLQYQKWGKKDDIVVLDGYHFTSSYMTALKKKCRKLVCIDDNADKTYNADLIINHNAYACQLKYETLSETKFALGPDYLLLRKPFLKSDYIKKSIDHLIKKITICLGGADLKNNTLNLLEFIENCPQKYFVNTVVGMSNPNRNIIERFLKKSVNNHRLHINLNADKMTSLFRNSDVLLTTASVTAWEAIAVGTPLIVGVSSKNQKKIAAFIETNGYGINLGCLSSCSYDTFKRVTKKLKEGFHLRRKMVTQQRLLIDRKSPERLLQIFKEL